MYLFFVEISFYMSSLKDNFRKIFTNNIFEMAHIHFKSLSETDNDWHLFLNLRGIRKFLTEEKFFLFVSFDNCPTEINLEMWFNLKIEFDFF